MYVPDLSTVYYCTFTRGVIYTTLRGQLRMRAPQDSLRFGGVERILKGEIGGPGLMCPGEKGREFTRTGASLVAFPGCRFLKRASLAASPLLSSARESWKRPWFSMLEVSLLYRVKSR